MNISNIASGIGNWIRNRRASTHARNTQAHPMTNANQAQAPDADFLDAEQRREERKDLWKRTRRFLKRVPKIAMFAAACSMFMRMQKLEADSANITFKGVKLYPYEKDANGNYQTRDRYASQGLVKIVTMDAREEVNQDKDPNNDKYDTIYGIWMNDHRRDLSLLTNKEYDEKHVLASTVEDRWLNTRYSSRQMDHMITYDFTPNEVNTYTQYSRQLLNDKPNRFLTSQTEEVENVPLLGHIPALKDMLLTNMVFPSNRLVVADWGWFGIDRHKFRNFLPDGKIENAVMGLTSILPAKTTDIHPHVRPFDSGEYSADLKRFLENGESLTLTRVTKEQFYKVKAENGVPMGLFSK